MNLFLELRRLGKLAKERHPMYERGRYAKMWIGLAAAFWIGYLVFIGIMFAFAFDGGSREPYHILNGGLVFISALDFILRFSFQRTPTQEMKPYLLLPIRRKRLIDFLLVRSGLSGFNFVWLFLFVPFAILTVTRFYGAGGVLAYCVGIWLLTLVNNYWYLLCRTLMGERIWWVLLPVLVYGGVAAALFLPDDSSLFELSAGLGDELMKGSPLAFAGVLLVIALMWLLDRRVIWHLMYNEMNKTEDSTVRVKTLSEYKFLDRYGDVGEYVRLELKLMLRNKMCRKALFSIACVVVMFSAIIAFTDIYGEAGNNFWILYNYGICGLLFLNTLMSYEGTRYLRVEPSRVHLFAALRQIPPLCRGPGRALPAVVACRDTGEHRVAAEPVVAAVHSGAYVLLLLPDSCLQQQDNTAECQDDRAAGRGDFLAEPDGGGRLLSCPLPSTCPCMPGWATRRPGGCWWRWGWALS